MNDIWMAVKEKSMLIQSRRKWGFPSDEKVRDQAPVAYSPSHARWAAESPAKAEVEARSDVLIGLEKRGEHPPPTLPRSNRTVNVNG